MLAILYFCLYMLVCTYIMLQLLIGIIVDNIEVAENMETMAVNQVRLMHGDLEKRGSHGFACGVSWQIGSYGPHADGVSWQGRYHGNACGVGAG